MKTLKTLPTLFKKTSTGASQFWQIGTEANTIVTRWGQIDGKVQETRDVVKEGKNAGKKNETTPTQQAEAEAQSQWEKKLKKGYVKTLSDAVLGKVDEVIEGGVNPMLAHRFDEQGHKIVYPAFAQPKFDGHRCIAMVVNGKATLWSRTRKPITGLPHIIRDLEELAARRSFKTFTMDGELYNHAYKDNFEELTSFIRTPEPKEGHEAVEYHVYDLAQQDRNSASRQADLAVLFDGRSSRNLIQRFGSLVAVETLQVENEDELMEAFEHFLAEGYEGLMVRNINGYYVGKRSYDLQKVKEFQDAEFTVTGVEEGRGKLAGHAIFVCKTGEGAEFRVKMKGELASLKQYVQNPSLAVGKLLTVKYQGITNKTGVPRFPVGLRIREEV